MKAAFGNFLCPMNIISRHLGEFARVCAHRNWSHPIGHAIQRGNLVESGQGLIKQHRSRPSLVFKVFDDIIVVFTETIPIHFSRYINYISASETLDIRRSGYPLVEGGRGGHYNICQCSIEKINITFPMCLVPLLGNFVSHFVRFFGKFSRVSDKRHLRLVILDLKGRNRKRPNLSRRALNSVPVHNIKPLKTQSIRSERQIYQALVPNLTQLIRQPHLTNGHITSDNSQRSGQCRLKMIQKTRKIPIRITFIQRIIAMNNCRKKDRHHNHYCQSDDAFIRSIHSAAFLKPEFASESKFNLAQKLRLRSKSNRRVVAQAAPHPCGVHSL